VPALSGWQELPIGGIVTRRDELQPRTGSYRTGLRPDVERSACVDCLLCWLYCPDSAVRLDGTDFAGIDLDFCKGCEICAEVCPTGAIRMVAE
jgi:2-oxoacid:acceptor oxidoreductase delta subunit (pyruvate/2-ketoisovalerate family)